MNYMAREGGDVLRREANLSAQRRLPGNGVRFFDIRNEFPDAWQMFQSDRGDSSPRELHLRLGRSMFPFLPGHRHHVRIGRIELFLESRRACPSGSLEIDFFEDMRDRGGDCECERHIVTCVASSEWPHLYHGVLDIDLNPLDEQGRSDIGWFRLPKGAGDIDRAFLLCEYQAGGAGRLAMTAVGCDVICRSDHVDHRNSADMHNKQVS